MSSYPFSFVIPVRNEAPVLRELLMTLQRDFPGAERVVVDGGSDDDSVREAMPLSDQLLLSDPGRATQMNLGARAARGDYLLFLHADTRPEFTAKALQQWRLGDPHWGFCRVRLSGNVRALRVVERAMNLRSRLTGIATGDQVLAVRREWFLALGGYAEQPLMEDVELCGRLRTQVSPVLLPGRVCTSSRRWEERGVWRTVAQMWWLRLAYFLGVSPARLHRSYYGG